MERILKIVLFILVVNPQEVLANNDFAKEYYGEWKAFSKACISGSILSIADGTLDWKTQNYTEKYKYFDNSKKYPKSINVPEGNVRHTLKITESEGLVVGKLSLISFSVYKDTDEYSMFEKDAPLLGVWWHYYDDKAHYESEKKSGERSSSWCLYTK